MIVRVEEGGSYFCAKSALPKLKVDADWQVPVHRNQTEVAWMRVAASLVPKAVPEILGDDADQNIFAMQWLNPISYPVWKQQLLNGLVHADFAANVGSLMGKIHAGTANDMALAAKFGNDADFDALRLDPYLRATATLHPQVADRLMGLSDLTAQSKFALIHGDISPKNILAGPDGPVFLDAECATYGDPAFDLAFCLNHLILKIVYSPAIADALADSFQQLVQSYLAQVHWEPVADLEARASSLLPVLALARVDGKSPVEYLDTDKQNQVRINALTLIGSSIIRLDEFLKKWRNINA